MCFFAKKHRFGRSKSMVCVSCYGVRVDFSAGLVCVLGLCLVVLPIGGRKMFFYKR